MTTCERLGLCVNLFLQKRCGGGTSAISTVAFGLWILAAAGCSAGADSKETPGQLDVADQAAADGVVPTDLRGSDLGTNPETDVQPDSDTHIQPLPLLSEVAPGGCGGPEYSFIAPDGLGKVLAVEFMPDLSINRAKIDVMAAAAGVTAFSPVTYDVQVYRMRYTTQDRGAEIDATALMAFPILEEKASVPSVVWMHQTTGMEDFCAPSGRGLLWAMPAILLASLGHAVVAPDYIGQNGFGEEAPNYHAYLMGEPAALGSLDSLRALWAFAESSDASDLTVSPTHVVTLAGGSQGGNVALWAQRYADVYLPQAEVEAVVAIAPPTDLLGMLESGATTLSIGGVGMAMALATARDWYQGSQSMEEVLAPLAIPFITNMLDTQCPKAEMPEEVTAISDIYSQALIDAVAQGTFDQLQPWYCYFHSNSLANTTVPLARQAPVLYITGEMDEISISAVQRADIGRLCDKGYQIEHIECAGLGHLETALGAMPLAWDWVNQRRKGVAIPPERMCVVAAPSQCK